jgi:hypothetical protein
VPGLLFMHVLSLDKHGWEGRVVFHWDSDTGSILISPGH